MAENPLESLANGLKLLQTLRAQVNSFSELVFKGPANVEDDSEFKFLFEEESEEDFMSELRKNLSESSQIVTEFEKIVCSLPASSLPTNPGPTSLLGIDPLLDKTPIPQQAIPTYKWLSKMHDEASLMANLSSSNLVRRNPLTSLVPSKKPKKGNVIGYQVLPSGLENLISQLAGYFQDLSITVVKVNGPQINPCILEVGVTQVMKALLLMRGYVIENVSVKAANESFKVSESAKLDFNYLSKHEVFRKISQHAKCAIVSYQSSSLSPDICLRQMLFWFQSYKSLFTSPCSKCNKILVDFLPPTMRDLRIYEPLHVFCSKI
ncbi:hypothetical protein HELRODRAFT_186141 [Helobdella robusta]|uniref:Mediator of RNA polymerase II transcription subunit 27 n=1 Tax=Helobdella robusta TaxID=6412 RepID=T1FNQ2_HELRO|nr:hypothetical protein HELRODRAFT_186141 [Helobdella robusta]ESN92538.1 hypothetical protein HELRODRAFT_186141 [Helobdella robusta]